MNRLKPMGIIWSNPSVSQSAIHKCFVFFLFFISGRRKADRLYKGPFHAIATIMKTNPRFMFKGMGTTIFRDATSYPVYMVVYEYTCRLYNPKGTDHCSVPQLLIAGGMAGSLSWASNYPVDTIKNVMQGEENIKNLHYRGFWHCFTSVVREGGFRALFKGLPAVLIKSFLLNAVTLTSYSVIRLELQQFFPK